jgi:hypothetical protein
VSFVAIRGQAHSLKRVEWATAQCDDQLNATLFHPTPPLPPLPPLPPFNYFAYDVGLF